MFCFFEVVFLLYNWEVWFQDDLFVQKDWFVIVDWVKDKFNLCGLMFCVVMVDVSDWGVLDDWVDMMVEQGGVIIKVYYCIIIFF